MQNESLKEFNEALDEYGVSLDQFKSDEWKLAVISHGQGIVTMLCIYTLF